MTTLEKKIKQFKKMTVKPNSIRKLGLEIIDELIDLNFQLQDKAEKVAKANDELMKISKSLQKEHKRIMKKVLKTKM